MAVITCIEDLRQAHQRRAPKMFYDYVDSGSWSEGTYRDNAAALQAVRLRQRVLRDLSKRSLASQMLGQEVAMPVALAPIGMAGMQWANGEILAARAAEAFGVPYILSTVSVCSIEDVAEKVSRPFWFQLYVMRDRAFIKRLIGRAQAAGCSALVLTVDLNILGQRHKDLKNGMGTPPRLGLRSLADILGHPGWALRMLGAKRRSFGNIVGHVEGVSKLQSIASWSAAQIDPSLNWDDVKWIRDLWQGPLVIKGVMDEADAAQAVDAGADALVVSNHGGRQLDGAPASIHALPGVLAAVGERAEVWMDGGIRSGQDVLRALATGAKAVLLGRAYIYGLGAAGQAGVTQALDIIRRELELTMAFCGYTDINAVDSAALWEGAQYKDLLRESRTDPLTGLANRRGFDEGLGDIWRQAIRAGQPVGLLSIDIDFFKQYNDRYGHPQGDAALKRFAALLREAASRSTDLCARLGGEEFAVLMPATGLSGSAQVAEDFQKRLTAARLPHQGSERGYLTASIGVHACQPSREASRAEFLDLADKALYQAKAEGRGGVCLAQVC